MLYDWGYDEDKRTYPSSSPFREVRPVQERLKEEEESERDPLFPRRRSRPERHGAEEAAAEASRRGRLSPEKTWLLREHLKGLYALLKAHPSLMHRRLRVGSHKPHIPSHHPDYPDVVVSDSPRPADADATSDIQVPKRMAPAYYYYHHHQPHPHPYPYPPQPTVDVDDDDDDDAFISPSSSSSSSSFSSSSFSPSSSPSSSSGPAPPPTGAVPAAGKRSLFTHLTSSTVCPARTEWRLLHAALDINNTQVEVFQPEAGSEGHQWFYTTTCHHQHPSGQSHQQQQQRVMGIRARHHHRPDPPDDADCPNCCRGINRHRYHSYCMTKTSFVMALVRKPPQRQFDWNWIQVTQDSSSSGEVFRGQLNTSKNRLLVCHSHKTHFAAHSKLFHKEIFPRNNTVSTESADAEIWSLWFHHSLVQMAAPPVETTTVQEVSLSKLPPHPPGALQRRPTDMNPPDPYPQHLAALKQGPVYKQEKMKVLKPPGQKGRPKVPDRSKPQGNIHEENRTALVYDSPRTSMNTNTTLDESKSIRNLSFILEGLVHEKKVVSDVLFRVDKVNTLPDGNNKIKNIHLNSKKAFTLKTDKVENIPNQQEPIAKTPSSDRGEFPLSSVYSRIQQTQLISYFRWFGMQARPGLGVRQTTRVTEIERRYLQSPAVTDVTFCPHELQSKVLLSDKSRHRVGDRVSLRVDLHDQMGRIRTRGGDDIRIWLKNKHNSVPVRVTDLNNGSYLGDVTLRLTGTATVFVSLTYPQEFLRLLVELRQIVLSTRYITAIFQTYDRKEVEATPCLPYAPIPGYAGVCNMTEENRLAPWFCGRPISANLSCSHPYVHSNLPFFKPLPPTRRKSDLRLVPNNITIHTLEGTAFPPLPPCWSRPKRESWELDWHQGLLANTTLLFLGDSNGRVMHAAVLAYLGYRLQGSWHSPHVQEVAWLNLSVVYVPHARPFNPGGHYGLHTLSTSSLFPHLHPGRRYLVVLHYWMHFVFYPLAVFRDRLRQVKRSLHAFLQRHLTARVLVRGPHVVYGSRGCMDQRGNQAGPWMLRTIKEEWRDLHDRVWLLDFWPLSLTAENRDIHPAHTTVLQMLRVLFGYACPAV
ncbi:hypothetical protein ACOMHN_053818 [Nucella lapillus]